MRKIYLRRHLNINNQGSIRQIWSLSARNQLGKPVIEFSPLRSTKKKKTPLKKLMIKSRKHSTNKLLIEKIKIIFNQTCLKMKLWQKRQL